MIKKEMAILIYSVLLLSPCPGSRAISPEPSSSIQLSPKTANLSQTTDPAITSAVLPLGDL